MLKMLLLQQLYRRECFFIHDLRSQLTHEALAAIIGIIDISLRNCLYKLLLLVLQRQIIPIFDSIVDSLHVLFLLYFVPGFELVLVLYGNLSFFLE